MANETPRSEIGYTSMITTGFVAFNTIAGQRMLQVSTEQAKRERIYIDCKKLMNCMYAPSVCSFMMELATKRNRVEQFRDLLSIGLKIDDIRRMIMKAIYVDSRMIINAMSLDKAKFYGDIPFKDRSRFGNIWQRIRFRIRHWKRRL